jgi:hypothetical protein
VLVVLVTLFQLALMLGAPWGEYAMGGYFPGRYSTRMRVVAGVQILVYALLAAIVLSRARIAFPELYELSRTAIWLVVALFAVGTVMNAISRSKWERRIGTPVTAVLVLAGLIVASS